MYFLKLKGRGHYSGYKESTIESNWTDERDTTGLMYKYVKSVTPFFKRSTDDVSSEYAFHTEAEAKEAIAYMRSLINGLEIKTPWYRDDKNWHSLTTFECSLLSPIVDKFEIVEGAGYAILKRSYNGCRKATVKSKIMGNRKGQHRACNICRIEISGEEPYIAVDSNNICLHCLTPAYDNAKAKYDTDSNSNLWKEARDTEMVTREI